LVGDKQLVRDGLHNWCASNSNERS